MAKLGRQTPTFTNVAYESTLGHDAADLYHETGQELVKWQCLQVEAIMATDEDNLWKNMKYGLAVSRRNGKGEILSARELYGIVKLNEKICHTAHRTTTSHDAFNRLYTLLKKAGYEEHSKKKKEMPEKSFYASKQYGLEHIEIHGGGVIDFRTRTNNGGLGEGFDLLIIDEAQEYTSKQESALAYTVSASDNPQIIMTGTPPTATSGGDVFVRLRDTVMSGSAVDVGWAEWSIDSQTEDISNPELWYEFNPSLGTILKERNIRAELSVGEVDFNIQRLGLWLKYSQKSAISAAEWDEMQVSKAPDLPGKYYIGVKYGKDGANVSASIASKLPDGKIFVEVLDCVPARNGPAWLIPYLRNPKVDKIAVDGANGQQIMKDLLQQNGFPPPILPTVKEIITANAVFYQAVAQQSIVHIGQPSLRNIVSNCEKRAIGSNGGFGFKSMSELYDVSIMDSALLAYWLASTQKEEQQIIDY